MKTIQALIKQHSVAIYFTLTFFITWGCMILVIGPDGFPITAQQFETAGALVYLAMLIGPSAAGILLISLIDGRAGLGDLLSRLFKWRGGVRWYAIAIVATPLLAATVLLALSLASPEFLPAIITAGNKSELLLSGIVAGLMVGIFEELGWTGFAVPRLRLRYSLLTTGLIVGLLWGAWHFIVFWESDTFTGAFPLMILLVRLFSWLPPFRILMVWVYDRTESLLVSILMHASLVASLSIIVPSGLSGEYLSTWILIWAAALWVIVAASEMTRSGRRSPQTSPRRAV
jgi:uncharacterized protein